MYIFSQWASDTNCDRKLSERRTPVKKPQRPLVFMQLYHSVYQSYIYFFINYFELLLINYLYSIRQLLLFISFNKRPHLIALLFLINTIWHTLFYCLVRSRLNNKELTSKKKPEKTRKRRKTSRVSPRRLWTKEGSNLGQSINFDKDVSEWLPRLRT